jgi:hypothetical protein
LNVQPVVPLSVNRDWNVIIRTILPIISQEETSPGVGSESGFGDVTQSFFFTPKATSNGLTWAVGPAFLWPLGDSPLGSEKWGAGPTGLLVKQAGHITLGLLANHIWSYAGQDQRDEISATFLQPSFTYTWPDSTSFTVNSEASYDWTHSQWSVPVNVGFGHLYKIGGQRLQLAAQARVYAASPSGGPDWGLRFAATFLFPR